MQQAGISISGRPISNSGIARNLKIWMADVLLPREPTVWMADIECSVENSAAGGYLDALDLKVVVKKSPSVLSVRTDRTDRKDRTDKTDKQNRQNGQNGGYPVNIRLISDEHPVDIAVDIW